MGAERGQPPDRLRSSARTLQPSSHPDDRGGGSRSSHCRLWRANRQRGRRGGCRHLLLLLWNDGGVVVRALDDGHATTARERARIRRRRSRGRIRPRYGGGRCPALRADLCLGAKWISGGAGARRTHPCPSSPSSPYCPSPFDGIVKDLALDHGHAGSGTPFPSSSTETLLVEPPVQPWLRYLCLTTPVGRVVVFGARPSSRHPGDRVRLARGRAGWCNGLANQRRLVYITGSGYLACRYSEHGICSILKNHEKHTWGE